MDGGSEATRKLSALVGVLIVTLSVMGGPVGAEALSGVTGQAGNDTTSPSISNVKFSNASGDMMITFDSDEQLGTSASDLTVSVNGPNGKAYNFDRDQFVESGSAPYTYTLAKTQAFDDGAGTYSMAVLDAKDAAGNNGGLNGDGSGLSASVAYKSGGGGGSDTAAPNITSVDVTKNFNGNLGVSFVSNESLGGSASAVTVTVDGPNSVDVYTFDRSQFSEVSTGADYQYRLQASQAFDDGDGYYNATVDVAADAAGNDGGGSDVNASYEYIEPVVNSSSVKIVSGAGDRTKLTVDSFYAGGLLQVQLNNDESGYELEKAGLTKDTEVEVTVTVKGKEPKALIGNGRNVNWTRTQQKDGNWTVTITGTPSEADYYFPSPSTWPGDLTATDHANVSMTFAADTLESFPATRRESMSGIVFMTDAQEFAPPRYDNSGANPAIEFDVSAPHFNASGQPNKGFAEVYLPQSLLDYWGVTGSSIAGQYDGNSRTTTLTNVNNGGVRAALDVHYSSGTAAFTIDSTAPAADAGSDDTVEAGSTTSFDGTSSTDNNRVESYDWDFDGDGTTDATGATPTHTFSSPGTQTVTLTVTDGAGNTDTDTLTVTVEDTTAPTASVGSDRTVEAGNAVSVDASASTDLVGITSYEWDFDGDGTTDATGAKASKTWTTTGSQTATVTVSDAAGNTDTATVTVTVEDTTAPTASVGADRSISAGDSVSFDATGSMDVVGITSYDWDFDGDGNTDATGATTTRTFNSAGTFSVTLTVADAAGNTDTATLTVDVSSDESGGSQTSTSSSGGYDGTVQTITERTTTQTTVRTTAQTTVRTTARTTTPQTTPATATQTTSAPPTDQPSTTAGGTTAVGDSTATSAVDDDATTAAGDGTDGTDDEKADTATVDAPGDGGSPGFGVPVAVLAVLATLALAKRRGDR